VGSEAKTWTDAIPEFYFDLIGKIVPGVFLVLMIAGVLLPDGRKSMYAIAALPWGTMVCLLILLALASLQAGHLVSPLGEAAGRYFWRTEWGEIARSNFHLLKASEVRLKLSFKLPDLAENLSREQVVSIYRPLHQLLKKSDIEARVVLPKMAAELTLASNSVAVFAISLILLLAVGCRGPLPLSLLGMAAVLSSYCSLVRTRRFIQRHFAYLAVLEENAAVEQGEPR
jgi:hypothetical protein